MKHKSKIVLVALPTIAILVALGTWTLFAHGNAIVEARVTLTAPYGNGFLQQVMTTQAFQTSDGGWLFEVWSKCQLSLNQLVDISVPVSGLIGGNKPIGFEAQLYKPSGISFTPWNGCQ